MQFKFNIPNKITIIRVGLIPLFAAVLFAKIPYKNILAAFIFIMLSISDFFDGYLARKKRQVTEFGKLIDPIADKLLISTALIFLVFERYIPIWIAIVIISREVILTAIRIYLIPSRIIVPASSFGKAKTVVQSIAIVFVFLSIPFGYFVMLFAVFLTIASGLEYIVRIKMLTGNKIVNLPNILTLARFLLIIPYVYFFLNANISFAIILFAIITLSDKLDGISARLMNQMTELGSSIDSFTDWTLIISTFVLFVIKGKLNFLWVVLLLAPVVVSGITKMLHAKKSKKIPVTLIARFGVGLMYIAIIAMIINFNYSRYLLILAVLMAYATMIWYIVKFVVMGKGLKKPKTLE